MNSRCTVHEYGGGDFCPLPDSQHVLTIDHCSKNIKLLNYETNSFVNITTPEDQIYRYGDIALDPLNRGYIYAIREDHSIDIPSRVINSVVAIPFPVNLNGEWQYSPVDSQVTLANVDQDPSIMYSTPRVHPSGKFLCWMEWSHPNMPWDQSSIFVGLLSNDGSSILSKVKVAGKFGQLNIISFDLRGT